MRKRLKLLALTSTGRRSQQSHPISHTEDLKAKLRYSIDKTLCFRRDRTLTKLSPKHNNVLYEL